MSELVDFQALLTVALVSFLGANALVLAFGTVLVGLGRMDEARAQNRNGAPYAILAAIGAIICVALIVAGFIAIVGG